MKKSYLLTMSAIFVFGIPSLLAFTITSFAGGDFTTTQNLDNALGLNGLNVEGFDDTTLVDGLDIEFSSTGLFTTTLPALAIGNSTSNQAGSSSVWDGAAESMINNHANGTGGPFENVTFHVTDGTKVFGIGFSSIHPSRESTHRILVNGVNQGLIAGFGNYTSQNIGRNVYLKIVADNNETINSVTFEQPTNLERITMDHVVFANNAIPEPSSIVLIIAAFATLVFRLRK